MCGQGFNERLDLAIHHCVELMNGKPDAMISEPVLWEVVSANLLAAIARFHHRATLLRERLLLLLHLNFVQASSQHTHAFFAILDLRLLVLAADYSICRNMGNAHGRVSRIHRLPTGAGRTERVDPQIFRFNLYVDILRLVKHRNSYSRCMDSTLLLGRWHALHPMHTALVLQLRVDAVAFDNRDDF